MRTRPRVASFGVPKRRFATVLSLAVTLAIGSLSFIPASAAQAAGSPAADPKQPSTPVSKVKPKKSAGRDMPAWTGRKAAWPSAATADLDLPLLSTGGRAPAKALVGGLPVTVSAPTPDADPAGGDTQSSKILADLAAGRGAPAKVRVQTLDRASAKNADAAAAVRITRADGRAERAPVRVEIDYSAFANAYGADWANRARLVLLPECALDEPEAAACAPRTLRTTQDAANGVLSADVELTAAPATTGTGGQGGGAGATEATDLQGNPVTLAAAPTAAPASAVVALAAGAASETGDFTQTPLSRTATWNAGGSAGGFSWNYPIAVPPAPGDLAPEVSLGYSSASVDGQTAGKNTQPSWIGEGWDYNPGFIERVYRPCNQDTDNSPHWTAANNLGDQCWRLPNAKIVWNGKSTELIPEDASAAPNTAVPAVWRMADDDGTKVEYLADSGTATTLNWHNERWRITTKDGTQYYFGMSLVPGTTIRTNSVLGEPIVSNHSGEPCFSSTALSSSWCVMAYRWNLDYVVDPQGNSMVYYYTKEFNKTSPAGATAVGYDRSSYLTRIDYGMRAGTEGFAAAPARILFTTGDRCFTTSCATHDGTNWPDTPWDLNCTGTSCPPASFWSTKRLSKIDAQVWTGSGTTYRNVDSYDLPMDFPDPNDPDNTQTPVLWLARITRTASDSGTGVSGGAVTMPSVVFYGTSMQNRALFSPTSGAPESWKYRITTIDTESGEEIKPTYSAMDSGCVYPAADPNPDANTKRCFPQKYEGSWTWWHKYVVDKVTDTDPSGGSPDVVHTYTYATSATVAGKTIGSNTNVLWKHDLTGFGTKMENRSWGDWVGYPLVTEVVGASGGTQSKTMRVYFRGLHRDRIDQTDVDGTTRTATITDTDHGAGTDYVYRAGFLKEEINFDGNTGTILNKTFNDPLSVQTGTRTLPTTWAKSVPLEAWRTDDGWSKTMTWLAASSAWRTSQQTYTYDAFGNVATMHDHGDMGKADDDTCTTNTYVTNTTANLRRFDGTGPSAVSTTPSIVYPDWAGTDKAFSPGDFNGDGKKDLISRSAASGRLYLNPGNGDGTFGAGVQIGTGWAGYRDVFSPGDFNGDGKTDVIGNKTDGTLWLWPGNGTGGFGTAAQIGTNGWEVYDLFSPGDFNGDGKADVIGRRPSNGTLWMWPGTGSGTVSSGVQIGNGWENYAQLLGSGDMTGDGKADILAADASGIWVYGGHGVAAGTMASRVRVATGLIGTDSNLWVATGDITGDGKADLLARQSRYIADALSTTATVGVACGTTPTYPADAVSASRLYYDQPGAASPSLSALPIAGALTRTEQAKDYTGSNPNWITTGQTTAFDAYGRSTTVKDGLGRSTSTAYTMTNGLTAAVTVTPPPGSAYNTVTTLAPGRGLPVTVTDANGKVTTTHYDAAGRTVKGWQAGRSTSTTPDAEFAYTLSSTPAAPSYVTVKTLAPNGQQITSYQILDSLLRKRQTQTPTAGGGRTVSDVRYDSRGGVVKTSKTYNSSAASATLLAFPDESTINQQHRLTTDGLGRVIADELWSNGLKKQTTTTAYDGDRVTVDAPTGGTDTTSIGDIDGNVVELRQYQAANASGAYDATKYTFDDADRLTRVTDPSGNNFDYGYDLLGRRTSSADPDSGSSTSTYDDANQLSSTRDGRGQVMAFTYDTLGRKTGVYKDSVAAGNQLAGWTYDTAARGQLHTATRFVGGSGGDAYTTKITSYDDGYRPLHIDQIIPAAEGALAGTRGTDFTYKVNGAVATMSVPAIGGLPAETLTYTYDSVGHATGLTSGAATYVSDTSYFYDDLPSQRILGAGGRQVRQSFTFTADSRRLATAQADTESLTTAGTFVDQATDTYGYDLAGNVRSVAGKSNGVADQEECFTYDSLRRMTEAYTQVSGSCTAAQKTGADAYWMSWSYDKAGNRTSQKSLNADGSTASDSTYSYRSGQTHTLGSVTTTGTGAGTRSYDYDAAGNTTSRPGPGGGQQTLQWDAEGHLSKLTEGGADTTFVYDANGSRLVRTDPGSVKTLTLTDGTELKYSPTSGTVVGTRYYQHNGGTVAVRKADTTESGALAGTTTLTWTLNDHHGTGQLSIDATTLAVTRRRSMPFGEARGTTPAWPGDKGFVGGTIDPTGLVHLGAREYDSATGRFISDDPITDTNDPQQMNGYAYSHNNPLTFSDPSGLRDCDFASCDSFGNNNNTNPAVWQKPSGGKPGGGRLPASKQKQNDKTWENWKANNEKVAAQKAADKKKVDHLVAKDTAQGNQSAVPPIGWADDTARKLNTWIYDNRKELAKGAGIAVGLIGAGICIAVTLGTCAIVTVGVIAIGGGLSYVKNDGDWSAVGKDVLLDVAVNAITFGMGGGFLKAAIGETAFVSSIGKGGGYVFDGVATAAGTLYSIGDAIKD